MSCAYVGTLDCDHVGCDGPVAVYACHTCPGGVLVLDPHQHQQDAHPQPATTAAARPRIPAPRRPTAPATSKENI